MSYAALLTDTCSVVRRVPGAFNPTTGGYAAPSDTPVYSGPCLFQPLSGVASRVQVGEEAVIDRGWWVFLPPEATGSKVEDVVTALTAQDPALTGREMVVRDAAAMYSPRTPAAARWLVVEDIQEGT
jgi:hypothetical protein